MMDKDKIILNADDSKKFIEAMENPPKPSEKLRASLERIPPWKNKLKEGDRDNG